jgi:DNA repair protein RecO (recombination protein O)
MPIEKTDAIVLRVSPFSATSHVVTWLTPDRGRILTLVKGACRPKSPFLGQYDLHYTCELLYYTREHRGMPIARECAPLKTRTPLRANWRAALCAGYAGGLTILGTMPGQPVPDVYNLLDRFLDFLAHHGAQRTLLPWFELKLLADLGFSPRFDSCSLCGRHVSSGSEAGLAARHGGVLCHSCRGRQDAGPVRSLSIPVLAMLAAWQRGNTPRTAYATTCPEEPWLETLEVLGMLLVEHLGETPALRPRVATLLESRITS